MKLFVLAIFVGIALSTSSFEHDDDEMETSTEIPDSAPRGILKKNGTAKKKSGRRLRFDSTCKWSELNLQPFEEISNSSLRTVVKRKFPGIGSTDCILFYQVENSDGGSPYYPFRIDRPARYSIVSVYGIVGVDDDGNLEWNQSYRNKFEHYLAWCDSKDGAEDEHPQVPRNLSCRQTLITPTTPPPQVTPTTSAKGDIPPLEETTTPAPLVTPSREVVYTTLSTETIATQKITPTTPPAQVIPTTPKGDIPPMEETTTPAPRVTPSREVASTTLSTKTIFTQKITPTIPPREVTTKKSAKKSRKGWKKMLKSLNCFSCVE